jgi:hypothetical protein
MNLARLFVIHAVVTFAAAVVLIVAPGVIPATVGITLDPTANLLSYLLGTAELGIAAASFGGRSITDPKALRLLSMAFIVMHGATALVEIYAVTQGVDPKIWANVVLRVIMVALFAWYGRHKTPLTKA